MRTIRIVFLLCTLSLASVLVPLHAQNERSESAELENSSHYVPPSAKQSVEIGDFYFRRKDYRGALSRYEEAAKDDPYYAPAYIGLGKVYEKTGKRHEALAAYRKYLDVLPSQKQADEAKGVHKAISRLERELSQQDKRSHGTHAGSTATNK